MKKSLVVHRSPRSHLARGITPAQPMIPSTTEATTSAATRTTETEYQVFDKSAISESSPAIKDSPIFLNSNVSANSFTSTSFSTFVSSLTSESSAIVLSRLASPNDSQASLSPLITTGSLTPRDFIILENSALSSDSAISENVFSCCADSSIYQNSICALNSSRSWNPPDISPPPPPRLSSSLPLASPEPIVSTALQFSMTSQNPSIFRKHSQASAMAIIPRNHKSFSSSFSPLSPFTLVSSMTPLGPPMPQSLPATSDTSPSTAMTPSGHTAAVLSLRPRTRSSTTIWSLPSEMLLVVYKLLHVKDLLSMRSTHPAFRDMIDESSSVWATVSFRDVWPSQHNLRHFERAAERSNVEALIKLGVAYLYNEGLSVGGTNEFDGHKITANGEKAAEMFCQVESLGSTDPRYRGGRRGSPPFTWLFIRPPWAVSGACCKECVFKKMLSYSQQVNAPAVNICIARTLELLDADLNGADIAAQLEAAANQGSPLARYLLWQRKYGCALEKVSSRGEELGALRSLRKICGGDSSLGGENRGQGGEQSAWLALCRLYAEGHYGGYPRRQAARFVRVFVQSSAPVDVRYIYSSSELTHSMRYILVDWLVEVASMKGFDSVTLHVAINVVDRFLTRQSVTRAKLQLLGVAAMVLCSRYLGRDIITIREAAWLTDNTYKYEDVVRMMGEISAVLRGHFRMLTSLDFTHLLGLVAHNDPFTQRLAEYLCELALLHSDLSQYTQGCIASACVLLARLTLERDFPWSCDLEEFTGYTLTRLAPTVVHLHRKCFTEAAMTDHRDVVLQAVKQRYAEDAFLRVSATTMLEPDRLNSLLGVAVEPRTPAHRLHSLYAAAAADTMNLIASPSRKGLDKSFDRSFAELSSDRDKAATPTPEVSERFIQQGAPLDDTLLSGYHGDREDGGGEESFHDGIGCDSPNPCGPFAALLTDRPMGRLGGDQLLTNHVMSSSSWQLASASRLAKSAFSSWQPTSAELELVGATSGMESELGVTPLPEGSADEFGFVPKIGRSRSREVDGLDSCVWAAGVDLMVVDNLADAIQDAGYIWATKEKRTEKGDVERAVGNAENSCAISEQRADVTKRGSIRFSDESADGEMSVAERSTLNRRDTRSRSLPMLDRMVGDVEGGEGAEEAGVGRGKRKGQFLRGKDSKARRSMH